MHRLIQFNKFLGDLIEFAPKWEKVMRGLAPAAQETMIRKMAYNVGKPYIGADSPRLLAHILHPKTIDPSDLPLARMRLKESIRDRKYNRIIGLKGSLRDPKADVPWRKRMVLKYGRERQPTFAEARGEHPDELMDFTHGGGEQHIRDFLSGKTKGYQLEGEGRIGIQVHPHKGEPSIGILDRSYYYANKSAAMHHDRPAFLTGQIRKGDLLTANNAYEGAIIDPAHIKNPVVKRVSTESGELPYMTPEDLSYREPIRKGTRLSAVLDDLIQFQEPRRHYGEVAKDAAIGGVTSAVGTAGLLAATGLGLRRKAPALSKMLTTAAGQHIKVFNPMHTAPMMRSLPEASRLFGKQLAGVKEVEHMATSGAIPSMEHVASSFQKTGITPEKDIADIAAFKKKWGRTPGESMEKSVGLLSGLAATGVGAAGGAALSKGWDKKRELSTKLDGLIEFARGQYAKPILEGVRKAEGMSWAARKLTASAINPFYEQKAPKEGGALWQAVRDRAAKKIRAMRNARLGLNAKLDDLIEFGPLPKGYKRPIIVRVANKSEKVAAEKLYGLDMAGATAISIPPASTGFSGFPSKRRYRKTTGLPPYRSDEVRRRGLIIAPAPEGSMARLARLRMRGAAKTTQQAAKATLQHELIHSLHPGPYDTPIRRAYEESRSYGGPVLWKRGKALGTPRLNRWRDVASGIWGELNPHWISRLKDLGRRTKEAIGLSEKPSARKLFNKVKEIQFKTLYQPGAGDEPPEELPQFTEGEPIDYTVQRHAAKRAGLHRDIRIGTRRHGLLSWATRKDLPGEGGKVAIHPQPVHPHSYLGWEGNIPEGYGAGDVATEHLGKALVTKSTPTEVHATLADQKEHHRLAFVKTPKRWLLARGKHPEPPTEAVKPKYKSVSQEDAPEHLSSIEPGTIVQPKIDGALVYVTTKGNRPEVFSHRKSKVSNKNILHTERVFHGRPTTNIPKEHQRTLLGELYGTRGGKAIEPQELGGILNTHLGESIAKQKARGVKLKIMPFDYANGKGESYPERLEKVKSTLQYMPKDVFQTPPEAKTPSAARRLYEKVRSGRHPLTKEGVIIHPPEGRMIKIKNVEEENVKIHSVFPGKGKFEHGGFYYADKSGRPLGRVGTGFTEETRAELPKYIGRTARVRHQGKYKSGRLRAPSLIAIEENK